MRPAPEAMQDEDQAVDRDAWQRALASGAGAPPRATDERIRAEARRALVPHTGRWWLPASLAASLLLAVMIVQWQYEEIRAPTLVTESDVATATVPGAEANAAPATAADAAASLAPMDAPPAVEPQVARRESPAAQVPAPSIELPAPTAFPDEPAAPPPAREREAREHAAPVAEAAPAGKAEAVPVAGSRIGMLQATGKARADARMPEEWYAEIEKLRAEGRDEEAEAELKRLEQAHPGWLEKHLAQQR
ncbi:MAG: hypothetical protein ACT4UP_04195 [Gammaproteobacteria bacterium]